MKIIFFVFKTSARLFLDSCCYFFAGVAMVCILIFVRIVGAMNGQFVVFRIREPYAVLWRFLTWGTLLMVVVFFVAIPALEWFKNVVNYMVWGF